MWSNWFMTQWDTFIDKSDYASKHCLVQNTPMLPVFKKPHGESYKLYRIFMELIDCIILDVHALRYNFRAIVTSLMYIVIGKYFNQFTQEQILNEFSISSQYLLDPSFAYNNLFSHFLEHYIGFSLWNILPTIQYCSRFLALKFHIELPVAAKIDRKTVLGVR